MSRTRSRVNKEIRTGSDYAIEGDVTYNVNTGKKTAVVKQWEDKVLYLDSEEMTDVIVPQFHTRMNEGEIIMNPMTQTKIKDVLSPGYVSFSASMDGTTDPEKVKIDYRSSYRGPIVLPHYGDSGYTSAFEIGRVSESMQDLALQRAYAAAKTGSVQGLVTLVELPKSVRLLKTLGKRLLAVKNLKYVDLYRRGIIHAYRKNPKQLSTDVRALVRKASRQWLEYRYGIRQLLFDWEDMCTILANMADKPAHTVFRGFESGTLSSYVKPTWTASLITGTKLQRDLTHATQFEASAGVVVSDNNRYNLPHDAGLTQVLPTMWELSRLSFVVDWFIDIGTWIAAWQPKVGPEIVGSWSTSVTKDVITMTAEAIDNGSSTHSSNSKYKYYISKSVSGSPAVRKRTITTTRRIADPQLALLPKVNVSLDTAKIVDLVALFTTGAFRDIIRRYRV